MPEQLTAQLPSPIEVFRSDPDLDRVERVAHVEHMLREHYGSVHVPARCTDGSYTLAYFANETDAKYQRRVLARAIVEAQIIEERRREVLVALDSPHHILNALRQVGDRQMDQIAKEVA